MSLIICIAIGLIIGIVSCTFSVKKEKALNQKEVKLIEDTVKLTLENLGISVK